jgi:hypothetical protein
MFYVLYPFVTYLLTVPHTLLEYFLKFYAFSPFIYVADLVGEKGS